MGRQGEAAEHYAKICTISTVVRWALAAVVCAVLACLGFYVGSIFNSVLIMCDSAWRKQVEAGMKGREGEGLLFGDRTSPPPDIMDESIDAVLCTFYADPARRGEKYPASCSWHGSWSLSLAHSVTIIPPTPSLCFLLLQPHSPRKICAYTHTLTYTILFL